MVRGGHMHAAVRGYDDYGSRTLLTVNCFR